MKKIGILGGTFNPPHTGHLIIANEVRHALGLDEVQLMPTATPSHKATSGEVTAAQRLRMVELAVEGVEGLSASSFEVERGGVSYTYDTMKALTKSEPNTKFYFIIGGDMIDTLHTWYRIEDLMSLLTFVGVGRPGTEGKTEYPVKIIDIPELELSSTLLRKRFREGGSVTLLTPCTVESYIREAGLYGCQPVDK